MRVRGGTDRMARARITLRALAPANPVMDSNRMSGGKASMMSTPVEITLSALRR
jgi:hypothetical protein